jgi:hypothetical protein
MTTLFPITIEVEEPKVGAVLRLLHHTEGVARFHLDFDKLKPPRGTAKRNGGEEVERLAPDRPRHKSLIIAALMNGPQSTDFLRAEFERHGHSALTVDSALTVLRRKGVTETAGRGVHQLTQTAREQLEVHQREQQGNAMSLPPPTEKTPAAKPANQMRRV